jgi:hypothetical protein
MGWRQIDSEWHKEAFEEGRTAAITGDGKIQNNYSVFSPLHASWNKGYQSGKGESK